MILVCGEALIDMVIGSNGSRSPSPGGGPFNTARALARLAPSRSELEAALSSVS
ncbi:MAG TPA: hypothetical protein VFR68_12260 [Candidatus Dormibacteraeota bacterium]|nr:hypothetical protein [Candidatus Dormibacteraeota bacterium]